MTMSERAYRAALIAYPASYRRDRGRELLATIEDGGSELRLREVSGLIAGGLRTRGTSASNGTLRGSWALGCQLAALVIFSIVAAARLYSAAWDVWYVRLGMHWPQEIAGAQVFQLGDGYLARNVFMGAVPLLGITAICRGRVRLAIVASIAMTGLYALPALVSSDVYAQWRVVDSLAVEIAELAFLASPAVILWTTRRAATAAARHSLTWLAAPFVLAGLYLAGSTAAQLSFWAIAATVVVWALIARFDPRYGVAALMLAFVTTLKLLPVMLIQSPARPYLLLITGAVCVAVASIRSVLDANPTGT
jgi:hypothetical protein